MGNAFSLISRTFGKKPVREFKCLEKLHTIFFQNSFLRSSITTNVFITSRFLFKVWLEYLNWLKEKKITSNRARHLCASRPHTPSSQTNQTTTTTTSCLWLSFVSCHSSYPPPPQVKWRRGKGRGGGAGSSTFPEDADTAPTKKVKVSYEISNSANILFRTRHTKRGWNARTNLKQSPSLLRGTLIPDLLRRGFILATPRLKCKQNETNFRFQGIDWWMELTSKLLSRKTD